MHFELAVPADWNDPQAELLDWSQVSIQRFFIRHPGAMQTSVTPAREPTGSTIGYIFGHPGTVMLGFCVDVAAIADRRASVYCQRSIRDVLDEREQFVDAVAPVNGKLGEPIELRPMMPIQSLTTAGDLTLRAYNRGESLAGWTVTAIDPEGELVSAQTREMGLVNFPLTRPGIWTFRMIVHEATIDRVADLVVPVASARHFEEARR